VACDTYDPGVVVAGQRVEQRPEARPLPPWRSARSAIEIFLWSRLAIWLAALIALLTLEPMRNPKAGRWDDPSLTHDLGSITDVWARWDSVHFLRIAEHGYSKAEAAFYPLYPGLVAAGGRAFGGHYVLAGIVVSLVTCLAAFVLLERVAEERLGADGARRAVLYLALFPTALFLQAVYSESLFLFLSLAAFMLAERGRIGSAGVVVGLAVLTRPTGLALVPPLLLIARGRSWKLATALPFLAAYPLLLWRDAGDPWAFARAEGTWSRHLSHAGPLGGVWDGARATWAGLEQLASGSNAHVYWTAVAPADSTPLRAAVINVELFAFLVLFVALAVIAWREFGAPYGLFAVLSLALPLSVPSSRWPLLSLPRFGLVVFPFFLALAWLGGRHARAHVAIVACSAMLLGVFIAQWALWDWVA
jgi:Mannosyltransferase (PIG-V)